jgi:hypothetical protein
MADRKRILSEVIDHILSHIPEEKDKLRGELKSLSETSLYQPPESHYGLWFQLSHILQNSLNWPPKEIWEKIVYTIVTEKKPPQEVAKS